MRGARRKARLRPDSAVRWMSLFLVCLAAYGQSLPDITSRLSEEAEVFRRVAPQIMAEETLTQRAVPGPPRLHLRLGAAATKPPDTTMVTREIISEYSFGVLADQTLHEFRQVISVDGHAVSSATAARRSLALGLKSDNDRTRKRMLEELQKYGLTTAAVDFGPLLLLFTKRQIGNYQFAPEARERIGADQVQVVSYCQVSGAERLLLLEGKQAVHQPVEGKIYARIPDGLPLRITIVESRKHSKQVFRDEASVDYMMNAHGFLAPAAITHRGYADDQLMVEDHFEYTPFRKFSADAEIKFETHEAR
jgi:hypothetical protein